MLNFNLGEIYHIIDVKVNKLGLLVTRKTHLPFEEDGLICYLIFDNSSIENISFTFSK
jgi:hypothetical protein